VDDTAQLQAALEGCSSSPSGPHDHVQLLGEEQPGHHGGEHDNDDDDGSGRGRCTIVLSDGVFHTDVLLVHDFRGHIRGQGQGRTIIRPIRGALRSADVVFEKGPTLAEPYPVLLHFADGGDVRLSHFTLEFPADMQVEPYVIAGGPVITNALLSAVMVDGTGEARLRVSNLAIVAADRADPTTFGSVLLNAIRFEGQIRQLIDPATGDVIDDSTMPLARGHFTARDTTVVGSGNVFALRDARNLAVEIVGNRVRGARLNAVNLVDLGQSQVHVANNVISGSTGVFIFRGGRPFNQPSTIMVERNRFVLTDRSSALFGEPGLGMLFIDITPGGGIDRAEIRDNHIALIRDNPPSLGFAGAVLVTGDRAGARITGNKITGPVGLAGVIVENSDGTRVRLNDLSGLVTDPGAVDIWLTDTTSHVRVLQPGATVLDEGVDNIVETGTR
jgi:hypothetical protein